ncbi:RluA family pseudouridine synthase [Helicobacter turcicus]|uniref:RNA pseudouridylate synthase n=1 Tax=Helicobacter turcicus TaxID=2867412 RepID=A0ABS7JLM2_9HELI|nr:RluA family pseudouridine synthase [Helicobacter turcicus]MBX7490294.1 RluA family pseudouridine synthase [Helicobacter turcicus]MBX7545127.1 RluA family pseudouridine synthase [Helicobacter turcicus]
MQSNKLPKTQKSILSKKIPKNIKRDSKQSFKKTSNKQAQSPKTPKNTQKAYKLLALQENISNNEAKSLIDKGLVSIKGKKILIARGLLAPNTRFSIQQIQSIKEIFQDKNILALEKPAFLTSEEVAKNYPQWTLLHRLDKETSGILLLVKDNSPFHLEAKEAFKQFQVLKQYTAIVEGILDEECEITAPLIIKKGKCAKVSVSKTKEGQRAITHITPLEIFGKKTKLNVQIKTGKTHQIRAHLAHIKHPIIGDVLYGGKPSSRILLHAHHVALLGYDFISSEPSEFIFKDNL